MKVAIDTGPLKTGSSVRGIGRNTRELIVHLHKISEKKEKEVIINDLDFSRSDLSDYDIIHYTQFNPFFSSFRLHPGKKVVLTIHDLIPLLYPRNYPPGIKGKFRYLIQKLLVKKVNAVLTISNTSKKDIIRFLGIEPEKIYVVYLAASREFRDIRSEKTRLMKVAKKYNLPDKFVLYVGDVNFNKNLPLLINACKIAGVPLVISGKSAVEIETELQGAFQLEGPRDYLRFVMNRVHPEIAHCQTVLDLIKANNVIRTGYVSDEDLVALYNLASLYVQPSYYEGFGLQVIEAMSCGTPVVVSRTNALTEVAGGAALVADPHDPRDMAKKISMVVDDRALRAELVLRGRKRCKDFSWEKTAKEVLAMYEYLASVF
jgi:glycosyltransferase involved in cell wall biosynthesis